MFPGALPHAHGKDHYRLGTYRPCLAPPVAKRFRTVSCSRWKALSTYRMNAGFIASLGRFPRQTLDLRNNSLRLEPSWSSRSCFLPCQANIQDCGQVVDRHFQEAIGFVVVVGTQSRGA